MTGCSNSWTGQRRRRRACASSSGWRKRSGELESRATLRAARSGHPALSTRPITAASPAPTRGSRSVAGSTAQRGLAAFATAASVRRRASLRLDRGGRGAAAVSRSRAGIERSRALPGRGDQPRASRRRRLEDARRKARREPARTHRKRLRRQARHARRLAFARRTAPAAGRSQNPHLPAGSVWLMKAARDELGQAKLPASIGQSTEFGYGGCVYGSWTDTAGERITERGSPRITRRNVDPHRRRTRAMVRSTCPSHARAAPTTPHAPGSGVEGRLAGGNGGKVGRWQKSPAPQMTPTIGKTARRIGSASPPTRSATAGLATCWSAICACCCFR